MPHRHLPASPSWVLSLRMWGCHTCIQCVLIISSPIPCPNHCPSSTIAPSILHVFYFNPLNSVSAVRMCVGVGLPTQGQPTDPHSWRKWMFPPPGAISYQELLSQGWGYLVSITGIPDSYCLDKILVFITHGYYVEGFFYSFHKLQRRYMLGVENSNPVMIQKGRWKSPLCPAT